jgi:hypothetical protein
MIAFPMILFEVALDRRVKYAEKSYTTLATG